MNPAFASTPLVRLLSQWTPPASPAAPDAGGDTAAQLAGWVSAFDAIGLHQAHKAIQAIQAIPDRSPGAADTPPDGMAALADDFARVRAEGRSEHGRSMVFSFLKTETAEAAQIGAVGYFGTVLNFGSAILFLGERPSLFQVLGALLIVTAGGSLALAAARRRTRPVAASAPSRQVVPAIERSAE